jgi:hypothetical protein
MLHTCSQVQQINLDPAKVLTQPNSPALPFLPPPARISMDPAGARLLLLSPFNCIISNKSRLKVTLFQL